MSNLTGKWNLPPEERFFSQVSIAENGCWIWSGGKTATSGYGRLRVDGKKVIASRYSYTIFRGKIPDGMLVCHVCDNPGCVNPEHLFLGTHSDNAKDCVRKGRSYTTRMLDNVRTAGASKRAGESHYNAKLNAGLVEEIRHSTESGASIAKRLGVSRTTVNRVRNQKTWRPR